MDWLRDMFLPAELKAIKSEVCDCTRGLLPTLTPESRMAFEMHYWGEGEVTDEKDEELNEIQAEIPKLDKLNYKLKYDINN